MQKVELNVKKSSESESDLQQSKEIIKGKQYQLSF